MKTLISNQIVITEPIDYLVEWCKDQLTIPNPEYYRKKNLGLYYLSEPTTIQMYSITRDGRLVIPFGLLRQVLPILNMGEVEVDFHEERNFTPPDDIPLFDYQEEAVDALEKAKFGVLESKAGSGKTRMGLALIARLHCKALWLTHTKDLLTQSKNVAAEFFDKTEFGEITKGKVNIGSTITFATVQTLAKCDLSCYRQEWDCIVVDECHRVCGTPEKMKQFAYILNSLSAKHKYGLSATIHRADGMTKSIFAYIGPIAHSVPDSALEGKIMDVKILPVFTDTELTEECFKPKYESKFSKTKGQSSDKSIPDYIQIVNELIQSQERNRLIIQKLIENKNHYNLILSTRLSHLHALYEALPPELQAVSAVVDGQKQTKKSLEEREKNIDAVRSGEKRFLFATFKLAKEGLDIPRLDRAYLAVPQNDYSVVVQSVGRIARVFPDKEMPICYDFVDEKSDYLMRKFYSRCHHYYSYGYLIDDEYVDCF